MSDVVYLPIAGFPIYRVGDDGSVWSRHSGEWKRLSPGTNTGGYLYVFLFNGHGHSTRKMKLVHHLVLEAFVGPMPPGLEGCHENGKKTDCARRNLRCDTSKNNHADRRRHGTLPYGEQHGRAKLTVAQVREIRKELAAGESQSAIARRRCIARMAVQHIANRTAWAWLD